jgi:hypothetical protein
VLPVCVRNSNSGAEVIRWRDTRQSGEVRTPGISSSGPTCVFTLDGLRKDAVVRSEFRFSNSDFRQLLRRGGFGGGVHAVLRDFVDAARRRFLMEAEELIERAGAFAG